MASEVGVVIKKIEPATVAFIACKGPYSQMAEVFPKLFWWIQDKGYFIAGPPSGVYFNNPVDTPPEELLWEVRCPVGGQVTPIPIDTQGVGIKKTKALKVATTIHRGPHDKVGETYQTVISWITANGYQIAGPAEEVYLSPPGATSPEQLVTEVRLPVRRKRTWRADETTLPYLPGKGSPA